jgi:hypothetical protein
MPRGRTLRAQRPVGGGFESALRHPSAARISSTFSSHGSGGGSESTAKVWARWTYPSPHGSDHEGEFRERVGETSCRSDIGPELVEAPAEVLDEGVPAKPTDEELEFVGVGNPDNPVRLSDGWHQPGEIALLGPACELDTEPSAADAEMMHAFTMPGTRERIDSSANDWRHCAASAVGIEPPRPTRSG